MCCFCFLLLSVVLFPPQPGPGCGPPPEQSARLLDNVLHTSPHRLQSDTIPKVTPGVAAPLSLRRREKTLVQTHNALIVALKRNVEGGKWKSTVCRECGGWRWPYHHHHCLNARSSEKPEAGWRPRCSSPRLPEEPEWQDEQITSYQNKRLEREGALKVVDTGASYLPCTPAVFFWEHMFRGISYFYAHYASLPEGVSESNLAAIKLN